MPRYFFHVHNSRDIHDREGAELPDLKAAQTEATTRAGALLTQHASEFWNGHEWSIDVTDARGIILCTLHFLAVVGSPVGCETMAGQLLNS